MINETVLTDDEIYSLGVSHDVNGPYSFARAIEQAVLQAYESHGLVTTTQAEAYANERIKAVLMEVAEIADDNNDFNTFDAVLDLIDGFGLKK